MDKGIEGKNEEGDRHRKEILNPEMVVFQPHRAYPLAVLDVDINQASAMHRDDLIIFGEYGTAWTEKNEGGKQVFCLKYYDPAEVESAEADRTLEAKGRSYSTGALPWRRERFLISEVAPADFYGACRDYFLGTGSSPVPVSETLEVIRIIEECGKMR